MIVPTWEENDPGRIEALFGPFGHWENWRKCVLSNCEEIVRAKYALAGEKISETRITTLARVHENYLQFLADGLEGRTTRERLVRENMGA
jgi:hypothetical protein